MKAALKPIKYTYLFDPCRNPFVLRPGRLEPKLSSQQLHWISRLPRTFDLEDKFSRYLPNMPQFTLRGHTELSLHSSYSFLISSKPIKELLTAEETRTPLFFRKLYATVALAAGKGMSHWNDIPESKFLAISLFDAGGIPTEEPSMVDSRGFYTEYLPDEGIVTFPTTVTGENCLGILYFEKRNIMAGAEVESRTLTTLDRAWRILLRRNAVFYRATLDLMLELAKKNWGN